MATELSQCTHRRVMAELAGVHEPWASEDHLPLTDESRHLPPMPGSGVPYLKFKRVCADCGKEVAQS